LAEASSDHDVLIEVDDNLLLIVGNPQGILGKQLKPHPIHLLNIVILLIPSYIKSLLNSEGRGRSPRVESSLTKKITYVKNC